MATQTFQVFSTLAAMSSKNRTQVCAAIDATNDTSPPLDFSFRFLAGLQDALDEEPRRSLSKVKGKYRTRSLRFNNNAISDFDNFTSTITSLLEDPNELAWLDLSFNDVSSISTILLEYPKLKILYLHGNSIVKLPEIDKLAGLPNLTNLTLHGNPIEEKEDYKQYVLAVLPGLRSLDFYRITEQDRATAQTWKEMSGIKFKRKTGDSGSKS